MLKLNMRSYNNLYGYIRFNKSFTLYLYLNEYIIMENSPLLNREKAVRILDWCYDRLGKSRFNGPKPKLIVHKKMSKENLFGYYDFVKNTINIYIPIQEESMIYFIDTIIHEFWHYKQNVKKMYDKYVFKYGYDYNEKHPYERTARNKARKLRQTCYDELFDNK